MMTEQEMEHVADAAMAFYKDKAIKEAVYRTKVRLAERKRPLLRDVHLLLWSAEEVK